MRKIKVKKNRIKKLKKKIENKEIEDEKIKKKEENQKERNEMKEIKKNRFIAPKEEINTGIKNYNEDIDVEALKNKFLKRKTKRSGKEE